MSEPQPGDIEKPIVQACEPLETVKSTYWNSRRCVTVECPAGTFGESVEVCVDAGTFSSQDSQDEANALADALARQLAIAALHCSPEPVLEDEATLNVTLLGEYDISTLIENANLAITLEGGNYSVSAIEELVSLILSMVGEYKLEALIDRAGIGITMSPLSENRIPGESENSSIACGMVGAYQSAVILLSTINELPSIAVGLQSGTYLAPLVLITLTESSNTTATLQSGAYTLIVTVVTVTESSSATATLQSGLYLLTIVPTPVFTERSSLSVTLRGGTYA